MTHPARVRILEFTDPACPVAFSAEPVRRRLQWVFGEQLAWHRVMVVLNDGTGPRGGPPRERMAASRRRLYDLWGMPLDPDAFASVTATTDATRLVLAARLHDPEREDVALRALRLHAMAGGDLDRRTVLRVGAQADVSGEALEALDSPDVTAQLAADMSVARAPTPAARALGHRLGGGGARYSTPSYRYDTAGANFELVGIHPFEAHEAVLANLEPQLARRPAPESATDVLMWAGEPVPTAEVAAVMVAGREQVRAELREVAAFRPAGLDGFWSLNRDATSNAVARNASH
jgi:hypothetical protein